MAPPPGRSSAHSRLGPRLPPHSSSLPLSPAPSLAVRNPAHSALVPPLPLQPAPRLEACALRALMSSVAPPHSARSRGRFSGSSAARPLPHPAAPRFRPGYRTVVPGTAPLCTRLALRLPRLQGTGLGLESCSFPATPLGKVVHGRITSGLCGMLVSLQFSVGAEDPVEGEGRALSPYMAALDELVFAHTLLHPGAALGP